MRGVDSTTEKTKWRSIIMFEKHVPLPRKLKKEAELIQLGHLDNKVEEIWNDIVT